MLPPGMDHFGTIGGPPPAPSVPMSGGNGSFYINLGAYLEPKNADRQMEDLIRGGFSAERETVESNGLTFQRVRTGPFPTREMAEQRLQQITHQIGTKGYVASGN
jgi:cell division septation protein DedD